MPVLDLALQGVGPDGHTASLFPHHPLLDVDDVTCAAVLDSPKPPPERVTFTLPVLRAARAVVFLVTGAEKAGPVAQIMAGPDPGTPSSLLGGERDGRAVRRGGGVADTGRVARTGHVGRPRPPRRDASGPSRASTPGRPTSR